MSIDRHAASVHLAMAMLAGTQLDVFTPLKEGPLTVEQIATAIGVGPAKLKPLLYALVAAELLTLKGNLFSNTDEANRFLVRGSPTYMGSVHELWSDLWRAELKTAETIRTGIPQSKHDFSAMTRDELEAFFRGLHAGAIASAQYLMSQFDFSSYRTLLDVGGGSGGLAITIAQATPNLHATVIDLPTVTPITRKFVDEAHATDCVRVMEADSVREVPSGTYDVAVMKSFLQVLSPDEARRAVLNIGKAINPGGAIYIQGMILDDSHLAPPRVVGFNLVFINVYDGGQAYTESVYRSWLTEAGFEDFQRHTKPDESGIIVGHKPQ